MHCTTVCLQHRRDLHSLSSSASVTTIKLNKFASIIACYSYSLLSSQSINSIPVLLVLLLSSTCVPFERRIELRPDRSRTNMSIPTDILCFYIRMPRLCDIFKRKWRRSYEIKIERSSATK